MAIQILPKEETFASQLGSSLGQGLQLLLQNKIDQMTKKKEAKGLEALGIPEEATGQISQLPPALQQLVVKNYLAGAESAGLGQALGGLREAPVQIPQELQQAAPTKIGKEAPEASYPSFQDILTKPRLSQQDQFKIAQLQQKERLSKEKMTAQERKDLQQQKKEAFKETKDFRKEVIEKAKASRQNLSDLERMEELETEGKLDTPGYIEFLKRSGFDVPALMNPGTEEFNKIAQTFMRDVKSYLGARISNFELEQFLKTIPSLSQSPEGRKRVISNLKRVSRIGLEYNNAMKNIINENKGIPPLDLMEKVDSKVEKKYDKITEQFKKDLAREVPEAPSKFVTGLGTVLGEVVGAPGKLLGKLGSIGGGGGLSALL